MMTPAELGQYEANHPDDHGRCPQCHSTRHPCAVRALVAEARQLQSVVAAARACFAAKDGPELARHWDALEAAVRELEAGA